MIEPKEYEFMEEEPSAKIIYMIYGEKGHGKTSLAMNFDGRIACISFDKKSAFTKKYFFNDDRRIKVFSGVKEFNEDIDKILESAYHSNLYLQELINKRIKPLNPDYIVIDGLDTLARIGEYYMRCTYNIKPFAGIANLNMWKVRRLFLHGIHNTALEACHKGVIYTTYTKETEIVHDGTLIAKTTIPSYTELILQETDIVLHAYQQKRKSETHFIVDVKSSKNDNIIKTGSTHDVTDTRLVLNLENNEVSKS